MECFDSGWNLFTIGANTWLVYKALHILLRQGIREGAIYYDTTGDRRLQHYKGARTSSVIASLLEGTQRRAV